MRGDALSRRERIGLIVLIAVSAATHSATLAVLLALMLAAVVHFLIDRRRSRIAGIWRGLIALTLGVVLVFAADFVVAKRLAWTPGGFALSFGRMLQDGIVKKYLDDHCPDPKLQLCAYKDQLPDDADVWFWGSKLFDRLGRFAGLGKEMETIALESVIEYPGLASQDRARRHRQTTDRRAHRRRRARPRSGTPTASSSATRRNWRRPCTPRASSKARSPSRPSTACIIRSRCSRWRCCRRSCCWPGAAAFPPLSANWPPPARSRSWPMPSSAARLSNPHDRYGARMVWLAVFAVILVSGWRKTVLGRAGICPKLAPKLPGQRGRSAYSRPDHCQ